MQRYSIALLILLVLPGCVRKVLLRRQTLQPGAVRAALAGAPMSVVSA
jgi:hypothetical protein